MIETPKELTPRPAAALWNLMPSKKPSIDSISSTFTWVTSAIERILPAAIRPLTLLPVRSRPAPLLPSVDGRKEDRRPSRHGRLLRVRGAAPAAGAEGQAGRRLRLRTAGRGDDREL